VGTTTLALNVAAALANADGKRRVVLADLQTSAANIAVQLALDGSDGLAALSAVAVADITPEVIRPRLVQHPSGLQLLLTDTRRLAQTEALTSGQLTAVIGGLGQLAHIVLLDLGSMLDETSLTAVSLCQQIVLAVEPQRIAVTAAQILIAQLAQREIGTEQLKLVVINRTHSAVTLDRHTIETQLNLPIDTLLPPVPELAAQAADSASLIMRVQPGGLYAEQIRALAQRLVA
jgi:pilus assembly protein CpaE